MDRKRALRELAEERQLYFRVLLVLAAVFGAAGLIVLPRLVIPVDAPSREAPPLTIEAADRQFRDRVAALAGKRDRAARIELAQTLAMWGNDTNRQAEKGAEAEAIARDLLKEFPGDPSVYAALGYAVEVQGRLGEAREVYLRGLQLAPASGELNWRVAHVDSLSGADSTARSYLSEALRITPEHTQALTLQGFYDVRDGKLDQAIARFERAAAGAPSRRLRAEALVDLSSARGLRGDTAGALEAARASTESDPSYSSGWVALARAITATKGDAAEATRAARQSVALYPAQTHAYITLGQLAGRGGDRPAALAHFETALRVLPQDNTLLGAARVDLEGPLYVQVAAAAVGLDPDKAMRVLTEGYAKRPAAVAEGLRADRARGYTIFGALKDRPAFAALHEAPR